MNNTLDKCRDIILNCQNIAIGGHENPDGDAIGACMALAKSLKKMGKNPLIFLESYGNKYDILSGQELIVPLSEYDNVMFDIFISLDTGDKERLGKAHLIFERAPIKMNIDHHRSNSFFGEYNFVDENASSTCEVVYRLIHEQMFMDKDIAACLYTGIIYDTAGFRHSSTSAFTLEAGADLLKYEIPFTKIYNLLFDNRSFFEMKIMSRAFDNAKRLFNDKLVYTTISKVEMDSCGASAMELDAIVNYIKGVQGAKVACFLYEKADNLVKVSFRGEDGYDVCALAMKFGGGGHLKAAGCNVMGTMDSVLSLVLLEIEKIL